MDLQYFSDKPLFKHYASCTTEMSFSTFAGKVLIGLPYFLVMTLGRPHSQRGESQTLSKLQ
jgi:hypothetical protein